MKVNGTIRDDYGLTDGATIILKRDGKNTNVATVSNQEGKFEIENSEIKPDDVFEIRFIGLKSVFKKAKDLKDAQIFLEEDVEMLDEVLITANIGKKPKTKKNYEVKEWEQKWYTSPAFILSVIGVVTTATIIYIVKKTR